MPNYAANAFIVAILTFTSLLAIFFIQKNASKLQQLGIYANKKLFCCYAFLWLGALLFCIPILILAKILNNYSFEDHDPKFDIPFKVCNMIEMILMQGLNWTILLTYYKFSCRLEESVARSATNQLRKLSLSRSSRAGR